MTPMDHWLIAKALKGDHLNGELDGLSPSIRPFLENLLKAPKKDRAANFNGWRWGQPDPDGIAKMVASVNLDDPPPSNDSQAAEDEVGLSTTLLGSYRIQPILWLAYGRIPLGKLMLLAGVGGMGKSMLSLEWAAALTVGKPLFDDQNLEDESDINGPVDVLLVAAEDDAADTMLPRFIASGGDPNRVHHVNGIKDKNGKISPFSLQDIDHVRVKLERNPGIKFVIIDPIAAYVGRAKVDDHRNSELTAILAPLVEVAAEKCVTILMIAHLNKGAGASAVNRIMGGAAYSNSTRCAYVVAEDDEDPSLKVLDAVKFNLAEKPPAFNYSIQPLVPEEINRTLDRPEFSHLSARQLNRIGRQLARIHWEGKSEKTADSCLSGGKGKRGAPSKVADAVAWLLGFLKDGPKRSDVVIPEASKAGFGKDVTWKAWGEVRNLGGRAKPVSEDGKKEFFWFGPPQSPGNSSETKNSWDSSDSTDTTIHQYSNHKSPRNPKNSRNTKNTKNPVESPDVFDAMATNGGVA